MSRASPTVPAHLVGDTEPGEYEIEESDDRTYVGVLAGEGTPTFVDPNNGSLYSGRIDSAGQRVTPGDEHDIEIQPGEEIGEFLERVGEKTGWESLSEFAREHLEDDDS